MEFTEALHSVYALNLGLSIFFYDAKLLTARHSVQWRSQDFMTTGAGHEGARTFSSGATVECDRNCFRAASPITFKKSINVASAEGASENFCDFSARWNQIQE